MVTTIGGTDAFDEQQGVPTIGGTPAEVIDATGVAMLEINVVNKMKRHFASEFPEMKPSHRTEFAARGLGFRTYASFLAALEDGPILVDGIDFGAASEFANRIGTNIASEKVRLAFERILTFTTAC